MFLEILSSGEYKICWFLETQFVRGSSSGFFLVMQRSLCLPDLSRKIEGPLLAGYKLIDINFSKDKSFQQYLVLDILTNPVRVTLKKKKKSTANQALFTYYSLKIKFASFLKS